MKRHTAAVIMLLVLGFVVGACTQTQTNRSASPPTATTGVDGGEAGFRLGDTMTLDAQTVAPGQGTATINITLPEGWHVNLDAPPFQATWAVDGKVAQIDAANREMQVHDPIFPLSVPVTLTAGETEVSVDTVLYYCNDDQTICTIDRRTVIAPLTVSDDAPQGNDFTVAFAVVPPQLR